MHLAFRDDDRLPEAALIEVGLDAANAAVAALRNVRPLLVLARERSEAVRGGALGRTCRSRTTALVARIHMEPL